MRFYFNDNNDLMSNHLLYTYIGPPLVDSSQYKNLSDSYSITCSTSGSPPMKVMWMLNEEIITKSDEDFEATQVVTNRLSVCYDNYLIVKNITKAPGKYEYKCIVNNTQGNDTNTISSNTPGLMTCTKPFIVMALIVMLLIVLCMCFILMYIL